LLPSEHLWSLCSLPCCIILKRKNGFNFFFYFVKETLKATSWLVSFSIFDSFQTIK